MRRTRTRLWALLLSVSLLLSLLPAQALAAALPEAGQTVFLPVIEEGEEAPAPQGAGGISTFGLVENKEGSEYVYAGSTVISYNGRAFIKTPDGESYVTEKPESNGILQLLNEEGTAVASSGALSSYYSDYETKHYYVSGARFDNAAELPAGSYTLQLVAGNVTYPCTGTMEIVGDGALLISDAYLDKLYTGARELDLRLTVYGFEREEELEGLTFSLMDGDTVVAQSTGTYRDISADYESSQWYLYAQMKVAEGQSIQEGTRYSLAIRYTGDKVLVDGVGAASSSASAPRAAIEGFRVLDPQTAEVAVELACLTAGTGYRVTVSNDSQGKNLYADQTFTAESDTQTVELQLTTGGMVLPMTGYESLLWVKVYADGDEYGSTPQSFTNPYANLRQETVYFYPYAMKPTARDLAFRLEYYNGCSFYKGSGDVLELRDSNGTVLGRCEALTQTVSNGEQGVITGTLHITGSLAAKRTYYLYLNGVQFNTVYTTDELWLMNTIPMVDYGARTIWTNLGEFPIYTEVLNSGGTGRFVFKNGDTDVLTSPIITGQPSGVQDMLVYAHTFTAGDFGKLTPGTAYTLVFRDGSGTEAPINDKDFTYTADKVPLDLSNSSHAYFEWHALKLGKDTVVGRLYVNSRSFRNIERADLEALKSITLSNGTDTFAVASYTAEWNSGSYQYDLTLTLDKPVTAGTYTAYLDGSQLAGGISVSQNNEDTSPRLYGSDSGANGYLMGSCLPVDAAYTGKLYSGYTCLTPEGFPMTLQGEADGSTQYLYFNKGVFADRPAGSYELRVYMDGKVLGRSTVTVQAETSPIITLNDEDDAWGDDSGDPVMHAEEVRIEGVNMGAYGYLRWAETREALAEERFQPYFANRYYAHTFEGEDGPRTLYVELSKSGKSGDSENLTYTFNLWLCIARDYDVRVPERVQGVQPADSQYTITATTSLPATRLWVAFYDADGRHASQQMGYVGPTEDGRYEFSLTFNPRSDFWDSQSYGGSFYYENTQSIRVFAVDMSNEYQDNEAYRGVVMGEPVERILVFGNPDNVILPQFGGDSVLINRTDYTLFGYASPNGSVTVSETDKLPVTAETNEYGYFTAELTGLTERTHTLTVADGSGAVGSRTVYLTVDTTPPTVSDVTFTFLEDNAAVLHWTCSDKDVDYFQIYKNDVPLGRAEAGSTSYNVAASADDGNRFTIEAVDLAGNKSQKTVSTADQEPPTAPESLTVTGRTTTTTVTLSWTAGTDNMGVAGYNVLMNGELVEQLTGDNTTYTVTGLQHKTKYTFTVQTRDKAGNTSVNSPAAETSTAELSIADDLQSSYTVRGSGAVMSIPLTVTAVSDVEEYTPTLQQVTLQYQTGGETPGIWQNGDLTVDYSGDRATVTWAAPVDADHLPIQYNVRMSITDSEGAHAMGQTRTVNLVEGRVTFTVEDSNTIAPISGAAVALYQDGALKASATTDQRGVAKLDVPDGTYSVMVLADGYQPRRIPNLAISENKKTFTIPMSTEDILQVETTVKEMTYDDMVAAGIDPNAPGNSHVFESTVILDFVEVKYYYNDDGQVVKGDPAPFEDGVLYPVAKDIFLIVPSRVTWLKEMFDVQLLVTNTSAMETVENCTARLNLPAGLSLADMMEGQQSATVELGDIAPSGAAVHHWYVRGDTEGDYTLSGTVTGTRTSEDVEEPMAVGFTTRDPISVLAGDAMKMTITAERTAVTGQPYRMRYELRNVSGKSLYNVNFEVFGGTFRQAYTIDEVLASYDLKGPFQPDAGTGALKNGFTLSAQEFKPTEVLAGTFTITFAEGLDLSDGIEYMLKRVFLFTGAGSTTEIPVEIKLVDSLDDAHTHVYDKGVVTKAATCTEKGVMTYTCTVEGCKDTLTVEIPALGHDMGEWTVTKAAACTETGTAESKCTRCDYTESMTLGVLGHSFSEDWTTDVEPTCTEAGSKSHHCTRCGEKTDVTEIPATGHTSTESDCTKDDICSVCHEVIRKAGQHVWGEPDVTKEATCTEAGSQTLTCTSCGAQEIQEIPALNHDYQDTVTQPTCTEQGYTTHTCSRCDDSYVDAYVDPLGHDWGEWEVTKPATETEDGSQTRTCKRCGATETETISKWPKQELWIPASSVTRTYGSEDVYNEAKNLSEGGGALTYTSADPGVAVVDAASGRVTIKGAGTTTITVTAATVPGKYAQTSVSYELIINKAQLTIRADDAAVVYGQAAPAFGWTAEGWQYEEDESVLTGQAVYDCGYQAFDAVGEYPIAVSGLTAKNYDITFENGTLTVSRAEDYTITLGNLEQLAGHTSAVTAAVTPYDNTAVISVEYLVDEVWTDTVPSEAGTYSVRAALTASSNLAADPADYTEGTLTVKQGVTVDTGDGTENVDVAVDVEDGTAHITIPEDDIAKIAGNANGTVSIDLGGASGVDELVLPGSLVSELSKSENADGLTVSTEDASITMSDSVLDTVADAITSGEDTISVVLKSVDEADLTEAQKEALESIPNEAKVVDVSIVVTHPDGSRDVLHELGGDVTITVPYDQVPEIVNGKYVVACHVSDNGVITYLFATCDEENRTITFTTNHLSNYAVFVSEKPAVIVTDGSGSGLYEVGATVTITAGSKSGYTFSGWTVVSGDVTLADASAAETTFTMPAGQVEVKANYSVNSSGGTVTPSYSVSVADTENGTVIAQPQRAPKGAVVTLTVKPDQGYKLDTLTVTDQSGREIPVAEQDGKYTFTMPASKVTVKATFIKSEQTGETVFTDVPAGAYYAEAVKWAVAQGVTTGTGAATFSPDMACTRAQVVTFLWRAAGSPVEDDGDMSFTDVPADAYYTQAVRWAVAQGITTGTGAATFSPDAVCTRAQIAVFLYRANGSKAPNTRDNPFSDVAEGSYYYDAVLWAVENGVTTGTGAAAFSPDVVCTRAQIVTFLFRAMSK